MKKDLFHEYIRNIYKLIERGDAREESFYGVLADLIKNYGQSLKKKTEVTIIPKKSEAGNPDFRIWDGENTITGYIEAKFPSETRLDNVEKTNQLKRYLEAYPNLILTNFFEFRIYRNGKCWKSVKITDYESSRTIPKDPISINRKEFIKVLDLFFDFTQPRIKSTKMLAEVLSKKAKVIRDYIILPSLKEEEPYFIALYNSFKTHLLKDLTPPAFADLFAQTFTYGLFIAKHQYETEGTLFRKKASGLPFVTKTAYDFIQKSFGILREVFKVISTEDMPKNLEVMVDDIVETLNHTEVIKLLSKQKGRRKKDPVYHLYETFLSSYDPERKKKLGIYYTPPEIISFIINSVSSILKDKNLFQARDGLATYKSNSLKNSVTLLDPALGTGTFFVEAIEKAIEEAKERYSKSEDFTNQFIRNHILKHFFAFEILIAPYVVSHLKTLFNLASRYKFNFTEKDSLNIFLTNTLEFHHKEKEESKRPWAGIFEQQLLKEQERALRVKNQAPILIVVGNPPYSISSQNKIDPNTNFGKFYESYKKKVRKEERNINPLSDDYIKFLAFAHWKINQTGKGIVGMITNNSYLDGIIHRDMRKKLYDDFDRVYILNLHGDTSRQQKNSKGQRDENVFDIKQGTTITILIKSEGKVKNKKIFYRELIGPRQKKYDFLEKNKVTTIKNWSELKPLAPYWFFVPKNLDNKTHRNFVSLTNIFKLIRAGAKSHRDNFLIVSDKKKLKKNLTKFIDKSYSSELISQEFKFKNTGSWNLEEARRKIGEIDENKFQTYHYRPFDYKVTYLDKNLFERPRLELHNHFIQHSNIGLVTVKLLSSSFFTHSFVTNTVSDIGLLSSKTSESAYLAPLWLYNSEDKNQKQLLPTKSKERISNIKKEIIDLLSSSYEKSVSSEEVFYYVYAILYSDSYRKKYLEFLKIAFPKIPFTKDYKLFKKIHNLGKELADIHLMNSSSTNKNTSRFEGNSKEVIKKINYNSKERRIYINKNQYFSSVPYQAWNYFIGGYQVLSKWIKDRKNNYLTDEEIKTFINIIEAVKKTISLQKEIDKFYYKLEKDLIKKREG